MEINPNTHLDVPDVYITAQQATQVFYLPWACQTDKNLEGWYVVYEVPPHVRPPLPNEQDYEPHINPDTYDGEFFQETRLSKKRFKNRRASPKNMEVDSDNESDSSPEPEPEDLELVEVTDADDVSMLQRLKEGLSQLHAVEPDEHVIHEDMRDSDDDDAFIDDDY